MAVASSSSPASNGSPNSGIGIFLSTSTRVLAPTNGMSASTLRRRPARHARLHAEELAERLEPLERGVRLRRGAVGGTASPSASVGDGGSSIFPTNGCSPIDFDFSEPATSRHGIDRRLEPHVRDAPALIPARADLRALARADEGRAHRVAPAPDRHLLARQDQGVEAGGVGRREHGGCRGPSSRPVTSCTSPPPERARARSRPQGGERRE
jgi:hypothetical protein